MSHLENQYLDLLWDIILNGSDKEIFLTPEVEAELEIKAQPRPYIRSVFGRSMRFDLGQGFPLLTTKKVFFKGIAVELLWFLSGSTNIKYLVDQGVHIWDEWGWKKYIEKTKQAGQSEFMNLETYVQKIQFDSDFAMEFGDLGNSYGANWRSFRGHENRQADQIKWVVDGLKKRPHRKSYVVSAWHPAYIYEMAKPGESMALPPCHTLFQFCVTKDNKLNLSLYQRSADLFLGVPFNIASYSLLLLMMAQVTGLEPGEFVHFMADAHIYSNHFEAIREQLKREPKAFPQLKLNPVKNVIDDFVFTDFELQNYDPHPILKAPITNVGGF